MATEAVESIMRDVCRRFRRAIVFGLLGVAVLRAPVAAQFVINEVLAANRFTNLDDDHDASDWIELRNLGGEAASLAGWSVTDDGSDPRKWTFPDVLVEPGGRVLVWCSGEDRIHPVPDHITAPDSPLPFFPSLVPLDVDWRYLVGLPEDVGPDPSWKSPGFDDTTWAVGRPGIGFGVDGLRTELPEDIGAVFLRHSFTVDDPARLPSLVLEVDYDDGFVAYLNGELIAGTGLGEGDEPTFASRSVSARNARGTPSRFDVSEHLALLEPGENLLAIALLNLTPTSRDLALYPELGHVPAVLHTSFRLEQTGETIGLAAPDGELVDVVFLPEQTSDRSYGRYPDGTGSFHYMLRPTPLGENDSFIALEPIASDVTVSPESGKYETQLDVSVSATIPFEGFHVRYSLDGSPPTFESELYERPLRVSEDRVVRAAGFIGEERVTPIVAKSYFLSSRARALTLPILSISMNEADFRYVHSNEGLRGRQGEREGYLEIFDERGEPATSLGFGLRLHGGAGRSGGLNIKKAYKAYFRGIYGAKKLRYPVIPDTDVEVFDKLVLRSNFNDAFRTGGGAAYIRDQLIRDLHEDMGATVSHGAWYNLFVNGRYLGVYNVVERMDKDFFASYFPEDGENWDVVKTGDDLLDGHREPWSALRTFVTRNNLADDAVYEQALGMMDVENFTSYMLLNIWAQNHDWPHNNWYVAHPQREDGQWIFLSWDAEFGIGRSPVGFQSDTFTHVISQSGTQFTLILRSLLRNRSYRDFFVEAVDRYLDGPLGAENVSAHIERLREIVAPDMPYEVMVSGGSVPQWERNIDSMRAFARNRNPIIRQYILRSALLSLPLVTDVDPPRVEPEGEIEIRLGGIRFTPETQIEFEDIPASRVEFVSSRELLVTLPYRIELDGTPRITSSDPSAGRVSARDLLDVTFPRPEPLAIEPATGDAGGGERVLIRGRGFTEGTRVEFGGVWAPSVVRNEDGTELEVTTPPGRGEVEVLVTNTRPGDLPAEVRLPFTYVGDPPGLFRRGDANGDGRLNIVDVLGTLHHVSGSRGAFPCEDALDSDDSGAIDLTDALTVLNYLFQPPAAPPRAPFEECGVDPTADALSCAGGGCP